MTDLPAYSELTDPKTLPTYAGAQPKLPDPTPQLKFGQVIAASFAVTRRRWLALALVVGARFALTVGNHFVRFPPIAHNAGAVEALAARIGVNLFWGCIDLLFNTTLVAIAVSSEKQASVGRAFAASARSFPALLPIQLLSLSPWLAFEVWQRLFLLPDPGVAAAAANMFALLAIFAFGVGLTAAWGLIAPVAVTERCNAGAAFSRSWRLLSGNRWVLAWLDIAMILIGAIPTFAAIMLGHAVLGATGITSSTAHLTYLKYAGLIGSLLSLIVTVQWLAMKAVSYRQLRSGVDPTLSDDISDVFA